MKSIKSINLKNQVIPIFVIVKDRLDVLRKSLNSYRRRIKTPFKIVIHDNGSTYEDTIKYLKHLENKGIKVYWNHRDYSKLTKIRAKNTELNSVKYTIEDYFKNIKIKPPYYVVTDPDIELDNVKGDILEVFASVLEYSKVPVVGPMLRIDDIPDYYPKKSLLLHKHGNKHWKKDRLFVEYKGNRIEYVETYIDTIFGLYKSDFPFSRKNYGIRICSPYLARHLDWYIDPNNMTDDHKYYCELREVDRIVKSISHWGGSILWSQKNGKRLLIITKHPKNKLTSRLHIKFISRLKMFGHKIKFVYNYPKIKGTIQDLIDDFQADILIFYTSYGLKSTHLMNIKNICKILVETDFYKKARKGKLEFYKNCGFDAIIQRGAYDLNANLEIPMVWLPFSADENEFLFVDENRNELVGFAGSSTANIYYQRRLALEKLQESKILNKYEEVLIEEEYVKALQTNLMWLTSSEIKSPHGKVFEAMAAGAIILSPPFLGEKSLFSDNCFIKYKNDCSDIAKKARKVIKDKDYADEIRQNAYKCFLNNHTHKHRAEELNAYIDDIYNGRELNTIWWPE